MRNSERPAADVRNDWRVRVAGAIGGTAAAAAALLWRPDLGGFWPGLIAYVAMLTAGILLGHFAGRLLFRSSYTVPPEDK